MFRRPRSRWIQRYLRQHFAHWQVSPRPERVEKISGKNILVLGIYLADRPNLTLHLVERFAQSQHMSVTQRWAALNGASDEPSVQAVTVLAPQAPVPKFSLLNKLLEGVNLEDYDAILVTDDDITLPLGFIDAYFAEQFHYNFALAQPARAWHSFYDHRFTLRRLMCRARQTHFVEIGPVFSFTAEVAPSLLPFNETSPMGWGYDFVWPVLVEQQGRRMGIIDSVSVDHSHREQGAAYSRGEQKRSMQTYLAAHSHLTPKEARTTVKYFWR
ncbi:MAG TPA: hypothetical protein VIZ65_11920 [Cellvibrionaceae bacterium]